MHRCFAVLKRDSQIIDVGFDGWKHFGYCGTVDLCDHRQKKGQFRVYPSATVRSLPCGEYNCNVSRRRETWTDQALADLEVVCLYMARDAPRYTELFARRVSQVTDFLAAFPRLGRVVPEIDRDNIREAWPTLSTRLDGHAPHDRCSRGDQGSVMGPVNKSSTIVPVFGLSPVKLPSPIENRLGTDTPLPDRELALLIM